MGITVSKRKKKKNVRNEKVVCCVMVHRKRSYKTGMKPNKLLLYVAFVDSEVHSLTLSILINQ